MDFPPNLELLRYYNIEPIFQLFTVGCSYNVSFNFTIMSSASLLHIAKMLVLVDTVTIFCSHPPTYNVQSSTRWKGRHQKISKHAINCFLSLGNVSAKNAEVLEGKKTTLIKFSHILGFLSRGNALPFHHRGERQRRIWTE